MQIIKSLKLRPSSVSSNNQSTESENIICWPGFQIKMVPRWWLLQAIITLPKIVSWPKRVSIYLQNMPRPNKVVSYPKLGQKDSKHNRAMPANAAYVHSSGVHEAPRSAPRRRTCIISPELENSGSPHTGCTTSSNSHGSTCGRAPRPLREYRD